LTYRWAHEDPAVDALHRDVTALVVTRLTSDRPAMFNDIRALVYDRLALPLPPPTSSASVGRVPFLSEPWYCCAEPNPEDVRLI